MIQQIKNDNFTLELEKWTNDYIKLFPYNFIEKLQFDGTMLSNHSCKAFSEKHNKIMVLNQIGFSKNYSLDCFINDLMQYKNVELHENILKLVGIVKLDIKEIIFIHEYAYNGTLRQYLKQSFNIINWDDKLRLAKQLVSAIKYLHENDIVHRNLHPEKIFIHKGDIKIEVFKCQNKEYNTFRFIQYIDPQYLQNLETYKLDKSSDIYSIGIILWEISSGITPFKSENSNLINSIIHGKREIAVSGTPKEYIKIYTECWQHKPDQRPIIQCIFTDLNNINFNDNEEVFTDHDKNVENKDKSVSETEDLDTVKLLKNYTELYNDIVKELSLISSIIATLKKALNEDKLLNNQNNILSSLLTLNIVKSNSLSSKISNRQVNNEKILYDLNQLFITQFNINGISKNTLTSMIYNIMKYIDNNKQNANDIFKQYYNHQNRFYFTSIIGFFYEYGIGTTINYFKAFEMYKQSSDDFCPTSNNFTNNLLKDNQIIGLISLGLLYNDGKGVMLDQQVAFQLFLKSSVKGSTLGKCYLGDCYYNGDGVIKNMTQAFNWYLKSAKVGNARAQNCVGHCYSNGIGTFKDERKAIMWYALSTDQGNYIGYNNFGRCYEYGIGTSVDKEKAFECYMKCAKGGNSLGQNNLGDCYQYGIGTSINVKLAFEWYLKSAEGGCSLGQNNLGNCYRYGIGTSIDNDLAFVWYTKSSEGGDKLGQNNLRYCYKYGY